MSKIKVVATGFRGMLILEELLKMNLHDIDSAVISTYQTDFKMSPYREEKTRECLTNLDSCAVFVMELDEFYLVKLVPPKTKFYDGYMMMMKFAAQDVKNILDCYVSRSFALST